LVFAFQTICLNIHIVINCIMAKVTGVNFDETDFKLIKAIQDKTGISTIKDTLRYSLRKTLELEEFK